MSLFRLPAAKHVRLASLLYLFGALACGCGPAEESGGGPLDLEADVKLEVTSNAFEAGKSIPAKYTGQGDDVSPPLSWSGAPAGTKSFAVICDDPDAPSRKNPAEKPWVHWVIYNISAKTESLPEAVPRGSQPAEVAGARQGTTSFSSDNIGYGGPMPPEGSGPHRYYFKVYALDKSLDLPAGETTKEELVAAMEGHVIARGELMGTYEIN